MLISIGGWTDSSGDKYSKLVSTGSNRRRFVNSVIAFLRKYNFQGLHFDWNYPVCWQARCLKDHASDKANFVKLIQEIRHEFNKQNQRYELAISISGYKQIIIEGYDVVNLSENVDFMSVITYDYHGAWENHTGHLSPLYSNPDDPFPEYSTHETMTSLVMLGAEPRKLVMGVPLYGQSFTLADSSLHNVGDDAVEPGEPGELTQQPGILSYAEICVRTTKLGWQTGRNIETGTDSYAFKGNQWVGYDDKQTLRRKVNYLKKSGYGGIMAWSLDLDDFNNECCTGIYPLLQEMNVALGRLPPYPAVLDCSKPVIISLVNNTMTGGTTVIDEETTYASTSGSTWWGLTNPSTSTESSSQWWPPLLTSRPTHQPKPTMITSTQYYEIPISKSSTPKRTTTSTTTMVTPINTPEIIEHLSPSNNPDGNNSEETTPVNEKECIPGKYYEDTTNCGSYFICVFGKKMLNRCPPGLHWNHKTKNCDWPSRAACSEHLDTTTISISPSKSTWPWAATHPSKSSTQLWHSTTASQPETSSTTEILPTKYSTPKRRKTTTKTTITDVPSSSSSTISTKLPWGTWSETPWSESTSTVTTPKTTSKSTWWSWSETPSTSWEWTPSTTTAPTLPTSKPPYSINKYYKVVCYFTNWAWYRPGSGKYLPEDTDPNLCTHVVYGFTVLDYEKLTIRVHDSWADVDNKFFERVAALKKRGLKVTVAVGGWNDSAGDKYSRLVNNPTARANFISSVIRFINKYGFEGLDLDWEYPKCWQTNCNQGPDSDKEGFSALVTELRESFDKYDYLLSAAVSPSKLIVDKGYNVPLLSEKLDWIAVMTYDFHGQWDKKTGHLAPIYYIPGDDKDYFNTYFAINYWIKKGANPRKIVMGMPMYGQGFTLANPSERGLNAPAEGPSQAGKYTRSSGFLAYYEICQKIKEEQWTVVQDPQGRRGPYACKGNQWVGFDDIHSITIKVNLVKKLGLGGAMIWALDLDDFRNVCGDGHYPLLTTIARGLSHTDTDYEIDHNLVTGVSIPWSTLEPSTIPGIYVNRTTTKIPNTTRPTRYTKPLTTTTSKTTTFTSYTPTLPVVTYSTYSSAASEFSESIESTEQNNAAFSTKPTPQERFKVVCYFTNWAWYRQGKGKYMIDNIDPDLCTHIIYAFAVLDPNKMLIKPHDSWADIDNQFYEKFVALKKRGVKVLLAIGGWNDSAGNKYSRLVNNKQAREKFITHVIQFLKKYNFEGLDVDWEYPKCWQVNCKLGPSSDKKAFADFISELREAFNEHGFLLTAAVSPNKKVIDEGYDVPLLSEKLDWISVMAYDYHGQWDEVTGHVAPMYEHPDDIDKTFNANFSIQYWVQKGANPRKLIMGMPMYGQSFTLASAKNNSLNSRAYGGGEAGESTRARGFLGYYEICDRILHKGWDVEFDVKGRMGPYARRGNQWVSFDDQAMIKHKSQYVYYNNLGGAMIWALDLDDFKGVCDCGTYPLLKAINKILRNYRGDISECTLESNSRVDMKLFYQNEGLELFIDEWKFETCEHGQIKKHPTDCTKYLTCSFGVYLQEQSCAIGLHFNEKRSTCDWPDNADCKPSIMEYAESYFLNNLQEQMLPLIINKTESKYKIICYLTNWSAYRYNNQLFPIQALDSHLCTHIVYGFAMLDPQTLTIRSNDTFSKLDNEFFKRVPVLKETGVKISLALGGWYDSQESKYSRLVGSRTARTQFIKYAVKFLKEHDFDGLEIDWEYPKCWQIDCNRGPVSDKIGFLSLLRELRETFWKHDLLLSAAVSPSREIIDQAYEVPELFSYVDWVSLMAYDYHGYWEGKADHIAPLFSQLNNKLDYFNVDASVSYWLEKGAPPEKIILGLPFYGQSFTLKNVTSSKIGSKVIGPGHPGRHTRVPGFLAFYEICELTSQGNWKTVKDRNGHYTYHQNQWISYNDVSDIRAKGRYIKENNLGGALVWSLDLDDFVNVCGCGVNPLLSAVNDELSRFNYRTESSADCTK